MVLEGVLEMIEVNVLSAGVRFDLLKEAAIAVASRAMPGSSLSQDGQSVAVQGCCPMRVHSSRGLLRQVSPPIWVSRRRVADIRGEWRTRPTRLAMNRSARSQYLGYQTPNYLISHLPLRYSPRWPSSNR